MKSAAKSPVAGEPGEAATSPGSSAAQSFRKKPVVIQAMQFDGSRPSIEACCRWVNAGAEEPILDYIFFGAHDVKDAQVFTLEGPLNVSPGDWIIRGVQGEFYPVKPDIFEQTYESCGQPDRLREALTYYAEGRYPDDGEVAREALKDVK